MKLMRICFKLLLERALEKYHNKQRRMNFREVSGRENVVGRRELRSEVREDIDKEGEVVVERTGVSN